MASRGPAFPARLAIECYRRQTYPHRELLVVSAHPAPEVAALIAELGDPSIRFVVAPPGSTVGAMRNLAIAAASGDLVAVWDDDDLSHPQRLRWQYEALAAQRGAVACVVARVLLWWPQRRRLAAGVPRAWENTLLADRAAMPFYSDKVRGSDTEVLVALRAHGRPALVDRVEAYVYVVHGGNLWGAEHFEMLFHHGAELPADDYAPVIAHIAREMPIAAYLRGHGLTE